MYTLSVVEEIFLPDVHAGNAVGIDFGLKTFLTLSDGTKIESPQWLLRGLENVRRANRQLSRKAKGSGNRKRARLHYAKVHEDISNQRFRINGETGSTSWRVRLQLHTLSSVWKI